MDTLPLSKTSGGDSGILKPKLNFADNPPGREKTKNVSSNKGVGFLDKAIVPVEEVFHLDSNQSPLFSQLLAEPEIHQSKKIVTVAVPEVLIYAFAWDVSGLSDGEVTLTARAFDMSSNQATSAPVSVTVGNDTTPPKVLITNPPSGSQV